MTSSASVRIRSGSSHNHNNLYNNQHQSYYHSNSIASSTNLSTSPSGSTSSNCSTSSSISSICASSRKLSSSPKNNRCSSGNYFSNNSNHYQHSLSPVVGSCGRKTKNNRGAVHVLGSSPPTNLTHYAGSKCFDAPAPTALPKPPQHWTEITSKTSSILSSKRNLLDDFNTHNLKLLLNVQS